jgi:hypothetical protein
VRTGAAATAVHAAAAVVHAGARERALTAELAGSGVAGTVTVPAAAFTREGVTPGAGIPCAGVESLAISAAAGREQEGC